MQTETALRKQHEWPETSSLASPLPFVIDHVLSVMLMDGILMLGFTAPFLRRCQTKSLKRSGSSISSLYPCPVASSEPLCSQIRPNLVFFSLRTRGVKPMECHIACALTVYLALE